MTELTHRGRAVHRLHAPALPWRQGAGPTLCPASGSCCGFYTARPRRAERGPRRERGRRRGAVPGLHAPALPRGSCPGGEPTVAQDRLCARALEASPGFSARRQIASLSLLRGTGPASVRAAARQAIALVLREGAGGTLLSDENVGSASRTFAKDIVPAFLGLTVALLHGYGRAGDLPHMLRSRVVDHDRAA